ncbi:MAB_1171c family putative transporter [Krasilnikovia sp. M28-CT-15]|uniref:MAB_1171c family putative transporter n=1 Tax=Krasilnikovia sp. M28-CT-15 TaxID=3373540 RepID=UPI0038768C9F
MNLIRTLGFAISALSSYVAFGFKIGQFRRSRADLAYRSLILVLALQCLTFTMGVVALSTDRLFGVGNLAILLMHLFAVAYCVSAEVLMLLWTSSLADARRRVARWAAYGVAVEVILVALFVVARIDQAAATELNTGSGRPLIVAYLLTFMLSQALPCFTIVRQCVPFSRLAEAGWLRRALRVLAAAALLLLGYCLARVANILLSTGGVDVGAWAVAPAVLSAFGIVTLNVGLTMQSWGPRIDDLRRWLRDYAAYRALYPLWHALYLASPGISLEPPGRSLSDLPYRLHRRVIEIRDGWRALRPYMDEPDGLSGPRSPEADALDGRLPDIEAARLRRALLAKQSGRAPELEVVAAGPPGQQAGTLDAEVRWLRQVSRTFVRLGAGRPDGEKGT